MPDRKLRRTARAEKTFQRLISEEAQLLSLMENLLRSSHPRSQDRTFFSKSSQESRDQGHMSEKGLTKTQETRINRVKHPQHKDGFVVSKFLGNYCIYIHTYIYKCRTTRGKTVSGSMYEKYWENQHTYASKIITFFAVKEPLLIKIKPFLI